MASHGVAWHHIMPITTMPKMVWQVTSKMVPNRSFDAKNARGLDASGPTISLSKPCQQHHIKPTEALSRLSLSSEDLCAGAGQASSRKGMEEWHLSGTVKIRNKRVQGRASMRPSNWLPLG